MNEDKYAELFASEAREHLAQIGRALLALEKEPEDRESLDSVFRSVHTIKGMAAAMGYELVAELGHGIESVLDRVRTGEGTVDSELIDLLLASGDALEESVEAAVAGETASRPVNLLERLESASSAEAEGDDGRGSDQGSRGGSTHDPEPRAAPQRRRTTSSRSGRVRVDIRRLDSLMNLLGELIIVRRRMESLSKELGSEALDETLDRASGIIDEMQLQVIESRMVPVWQVFDRFPRAVRDVSRSLGKEVEFRISGKELELDRSMLDAISDPLVHLLRNAVDHGIEPPEEREAAGKPRTGTIELSARRERSRVVIVVEDDGRGVDRDRLMGRARELGLLAADEEPSDNELFRIMARPGLSTAKEITQVSGRGVGLNVVEDFVRGFGGSIEFSTAAGQGSRLRLELPLTVAVVRALIIEVKGHEYALPVTFTLASFEHGSDEVERAHGREWVRWREERLPLMRLDELFGQGGGNGNGNMSLVAVEFGGRRLALGVDRLIGEEEIVVKDFDPPVGALSIFSGATVRANGKPALILDVASLS